ncbi:hypothetical protein D3C78_1345540 [compost metagenome]
MNALDGIDHLFHKGFVGDALLSPLEIGEMRDVRAGNEGLAARAAKQDGADLAVAAALGNAFEQRLVHALRHGIVALGAVDGDFRRARSLDAELDQLAHADSA